MKLEDVKIGMKVRLLSKNALNEYDNIEDWYKACNEWKYKDDIQQIKKQGYGVVTDIDRDCTIWVANNISNDGWAFLPSDLEPYEEEDELDKTKLKYIPSPTMDVKFYDKNDKVIFEGVMDLSKDDKKSVVEIKDLDWW